MNTTDETRARITAEVLTAMPHVAKAIHFKTTNNTWRMLGQVASGADLLEHQLAINEIMQDMVTDDVTRTRNDYESRQHGVDPSTDNYREVAIALQLIQEYASKVLMIMAGRQIAILSSLIKVRPDQMTQPIPELRQWMFSHPEYVVAASAG